MQLQDLRYGPTVRSGYFRRCKRDVIRRELLTQGSKLASRTGTVLLMVLPKLPLQMRP